MIAGERCMVAVGDAEIDVRDMPFMPPADKVIAIDLPPPISVNKTRKINWKSHRSAEKWLKQSDMRIMATGGVRRLGKMAGAFEIKIVVDAERCHCDLDNTAKILIDYCKRLEVVVDDSPQYMKRVIIEWGHAPTGCRITLREWGADVSRETVRA